MRIAFASSDGKSVNQHFGMAEQFIIWEVEPAHAEPVGRVLLGSGGEDREDRILARAKALDGCALVYMTQIGGPSAAKLVGRHIHPAKVPENTPISEAVARLQGVLQGSPPPWLRKAAGLTSPSAKCEGPLDE